MAAEDAQETEVPVQGGSEGSPYFLDPEGPVLVSPEAVTADPVVVEIASAATVNEPGADAEADAIEAISPSSRGSERSDTEESVERDDGVATWQDELLDELEDALDNKGTTTSDGRPLVLLPAEDAREIKYYLLLHGPLPFIGKYCIYSHEYSAAQLLSALGFRLPVDVAERFDDRQLQIGLQVAIRHVLSKRQRLDEPRTLDGVVDLIEKSSKILVLTGAGISTSLGIPDFRSDNGIYAQVEHMGLTDPQEVFDISLFREDPSIFYTIAKMVLPSHSTASPTHQFIKLLEEHGKLLRNYTQNIDNLEYYAGISADRVVQCHGSFGTARCITCLKEVPGETIHDDIRDGKVPKCSFCSKKRKIREDDECGHEELSHGVMKPNITFFGENLPRRFDRMLLDEGDAKKCDLLICIGTSLKVAPVSEIVKLVPPIVPQIFISKTPANHMNFDVSFLGSCDDVVELLCAKLSWALDHPMEKRTSDLEDCEFPGGRISADDGIYTFHYRGETTPPRARDDVESRPTGE